MKKKDKRVSITVTFDDALLLELAIKAHEADMKLNDFIEMILEDYIKEEKKKK